MIRDDDDEPAQRVRGLVRPPPDQGAEADRLHAEVRARLFGGPAPRMTIGPYLVIRRLGRGGMGTVHLARRDGESFAVKTVIDPHPIALARLRREARALRELVHPHIVRIEDTGEYEGGLYVAMEYIEGPTLREHLGQARSWKDVVSLVSEVGDALAAAHRLGVLHRDVKPDNVLIDRYGTAKLVDFGLAKALPGTRAQTHDTLADSLTRTGAALGTVGYAAPEQLLGRAVDPRTDQFGLCATLYEMLWGRLPFSGATTDAIALAAIAGRVDRPPTNTHVPDHIVAAILRGLSPDPADRHPDMHTLVTRLRT